MSLRSIKMLPYLLQLLAEPRTKAFLRSLLHCLAVGAGFNTRGMQNVGLVYAMQPGLTFIYPDLKERRQAYKRYVKHFQSHPFWTPCIVGIFLNFEEAIASGKMPATLLEKSKERISYTLSAVGDSVFAGTLLITWSLLTICLILSGHTVLPIVLGVITLIGLQIFRAATFAYGAHFGFQFLATLKKWNLINWGQRIKFLNAGLLLWLWTLIWPVHSHWLEWSVGVALLLLFGRFVRLGQASRFVVVIAYVFIIDGYPYLKEWVQNLF